MALTSAQHDRALGAILASAAGDALGAPYEFQPAVLPPMPIVVQAGGPWELGEWTDDTSMALPILRALADGRSLDDEAALDRIVGEWVQWSRDAKDVGVQTRAVFGSMQGDGAASARAAAERVHRVNGRSGGNGSLMRTGPVALGYLGDQAGAARAARAISDLTHHDPRAGDASVIWSVAITHAIETGDLDLERGIAHVEGAEWQQYWRDQAAAGDRRMPWELTANNGWVVGAFQAAWSAIAHGGTLAETLELAVRCGGDTDTVAAIAGSLAGAVYGATALPAELTEHLHGWWSERAVGSAQDLSGMALSAIGVGRR
ncbi:ADP-ribosylglycohydrolase family protein [Agrococcus sp. ARC_14]|uniref:ADP-ribosylglycohydrolase family protein n=1 Tax=Agrococcus sp. ARC_14 TaxID=2919927 RepID=UPI001F058AB8|nr:ADP-ribosylglycohydrolase family protein [Agrococcus sp. ARC_14]